MGRKVTMRPPTIAGLLRIMNPTTRRRAEATVAVVVALAVIAVGAWLFKPRKLDGESRRADASAAASAQVEAAVAKTDAAAQATAAAERAKAATAAASITQIGIAAADAPPSPHTDFIRREVAWVSPLLPAPDAAALIAAERRRLAVVEGRLDEARRLYAAADKDRAALLDRATAAERARAAAELERDAAFGARRAADKAIGEAAAANLALARRSAQQWALIIALVVVALFLWLTNISPTKIGAALARIRAGELPGQAFDDVVPLWLRGRVQTGARLAVPSEDKKQ